MSGKSIIFDDKKINKSSFYKNKKLFNIYDIDVTKILASTKEPYNKNFHLNTTLDMMIMIRLVHYIQCFLQWLCMLSTLIVTR